MSLKFRKRTSALACILPGVKSSASSTSKGQWLKDHDGQNDNGSDDDCSHLLLNDKLEMKAYNLEKQQPEEGTEQLHPLNDTVSSDSTSSRSSIQTPRGATSDSASTHSSSGWRDLTLELDQSSMNSISSLPSSMKSMSLSAPNSPYYSVYSSPTTSSLYSLTTSSQGTSVSTSAPVTPTRTSRLPLTSPLPRRRPSHQKSNSASSIMLPMALPPPPCEQVQNTLTLLKSIKNQIKALKRRESHLSTKLHVQRRERQQMQEQIAHLETRRLRVEAMFVRPLPLILLLPAEGTSDYDVCLVSEGQDAWNGLEQQQPLMRIQLTHHALPERLRNRKGPLLLHFGPTLTQPMAAAVTCLPILDYVDHLDLQPMVQQIDFSFWDRVTCGHVLEADPWNELSAESCHFLFEALMDHKHIWKDQWMVHVVDKKTRRIQWILQQEADSLYYGVIPSAPTLPVESSSSSAWVELD